MRKMITGLRPKKSDLRRYWKQSSFWDPLCTPSNTPTFNIQINLIVPVIHLQHTCISSRNIPVICLSSSISVSIRLVDSQDHDLIYIICKTMKISVNMPFSAIPLSAFVHLYSWVCFEWSGDNKVRIVFWAAIFDTQCNEIHLSSSFKLQ